MFALDFGDLDTYVKTFTENGILDIIGYKWQGRENIKKNWVPCPITWRKRNLSQKMGVGAYIKNPYSLEKIRLAIRAELDT